MKRTNRILVVARPVDMAYIERLIEHFDSPAEMATKMERKLNYLQASSFLEIARDMLMRGREDSGSSGGSQISGSNGNQQSQGFGSSQSSGTFGGSNSGFGSNSRSGSSGFGSGSGGSTSGADLGGAG
ncbi:MAG: hypothetical protein KDN20_26820, partial [Verrucomicrobiae bacterium]|nr:hypothetical protein [Verrucomicrobiae bacterium]